MNLRGPTPTGRRASPPLARPAADADQGRRDSTLNRINARYYANAIVTKDGGGGSTFQEPVAPDPLAIFRGPRRETGAVSHRASSGFVR
jgi:hypothetical protein